MLVAEGLEKDYGDGLGLAATDLRVDGGELVLLVGSNGAGKSTLLALAAAALDPTAGRVTIRGALAGSIDARRMTSYLPDTPVLYDDLSVREHLEYVSGLHATPNARERAEVLLQAYKLTSRADDLPARFSRGLRQKTAIALGLLRPYDVLLVDEPFVGLDAPAQVTLTEHLVQAAAEGAAVVVGSHHLELATRATRCVGLRDGRVVYDGAPDHGAIARVLDR